MLQERINELDSGILTIEGDKVHVVGFSNEKMLLSFLHNNKKNWKLIGLYDLEELHFYNIHNNALIIVIKDGKEIGKYQYVPVYKGTIVYNSEDDKSTSITFTIRKSVYSNHFHFLSEKISRIFENKESITNHIREKFGASIDF